MSSGPGTESSLDYLRARYYDPSTGQFISRDPITSVTRQPYVYVSDNPLNAADPGGLITTGICIHAPAIGIIGYAGGEGCIQAAVGSNGNVQFGFSESGTVGAGTPSVSLVSVGKQFSNGNTLSDLNGPFGTLGGSVGEGLYGGLDGFIGKNSCGNTIVGGEASVGLGARGLPAFEMHGGVSGTSTQTVLNVDARQHPIISAVLSFLVSLW